MKRETQHIEWKASWRDEYLKWLAGFANAEGGVLVIGMDDQGVPVGVADAKSLLEVLPNKIRDVLGILANIRLVRKSGKELVEIRVEPYPNPVSDKGEYHIRSGSTKQELKGAALDRFLLRKYGRTWDSVPVPHVTVRQLSKPAFATFRRLARQSERMAADDLKGSAESLLEKLHLLEGKYLTRAALVLFHPDPEKFFVGACVKVGFFRDDAELIYHDVVRGDLFTQVSATVDLLRTKYLKAAITYQGIHRVETFPVPEPALREAVLNAIIHKDYAIGSPIQIRVYDDKLMIWNPGHLPPDWTPAKLRGVHPSEPFNPRVANVFFRSGEIEAWGRGIERIFRACKDAGFPEPVIKYEANGWWVHFEFAKEIVDRLRGDQPGNDSAALTETREKPREKTREKLLRLVKADPAISSETLATALGITRKGVEWHIKRLKTDGLLVRVGADKGGHWEARD